ncbi:hypothetical protein ACFWNN_42585 [Lentzea sp. NPDC058450]|uniref:hypothetical protein n=1 Tax=Lentzea sp. NPDC058450 TaxID=3346505 RepID=UPI00365D813A
MVQPFLTDYHYYALFDEFDSMKDIAHAKGLYRSIRPAHEEKYEGHGAWGWSHDLSDARDYDARHVYRAATPAEVEFLTQRTDAASPVPSTPHVDPPEVLVLLEARRRAEPRDGHYYFAEFERPSDFLDVDRAFALIRCSAESGKWETYVRDGLWTGREKPYNGAVLPVDREDADRVIRSREAAGTRYFAVKSTGDEELVRHTVSGDDIRDDLGWRQADLMTHVDPSWTVQEHSAFSFAWARNFATTQARLKKFGDKYGKRANDYWAVFPTRNDIYDFSKVLFVVRRDYNPYYGRYEESTYERWTPDGWQPTRPPISLGFAILPISEEEFDRLTEPRP